MSDITLVFGLLLVLGLGLAGMLTTWWLLFPRMVERSRQRLAVTPWRTFWMGAAALFLSSIPIVLLVSLPFGPAKFAGFASIFMILTFATIGASGIAAELANRMAHFSKPDTPKIVNFVRAALAFELALAVPVLGWLIVLPFALVFSFGASVFALLHWVPRSAAAGTAPVEMPSNAQSV